jgi:hypothetical protein
MSELLHPTWADGLAETDPSLLVVLDDRVIPSSEYYDGALAGWQGDDPYAELTDLEDARSGHGYHAAKKPTTDEPGRERDLFIRRPVVPADDLVSLLATLARFDNPHKGTRSHSLGTDRENGLHSTILSTRGLTGISMPEDEELFDPTRRVPALAQALGNLTLSGDVELFGNGEKYHVALTFAHRAIRNLTSQRDALVREHFRALSLRPTERNFRPHISLVTTVHPEIAEQVVKVVRSHPQLPKKVSLASAHSTFSNTHYAEATV